MMIQFLVTLLPYTVAALSSFSIDKNGAFHPVSKLHELQDASQIHTPPGKRSLIRTAQESQKSVVLAHQWQGGTIHETDTWATTSFSYPPYSMFLPIFANQQQRQMWEKGGGHGFLSGNKTCAKFLPAQVLQDKVAMCNTTDPNGFWRDELLVRLGSTLPMHSCSALAKIVQTNNPNPGPEAVADISEGGGGDPSWSIQGFINPGGPAMDIAQNIDLYNKYKVKVVVEERVGTKKYNNSLTVSILKKAGFGSDRTVKLCAGKGEHFGGDPQTGCVKSVNPKLALGCSRSILHPLTARRFRDLMGVKAFRGDAQGTVVFFSREGPGAGANNGGRHFSNYAEVKTAMQSVCTERGLKFVVRVQPITDVDALVESLAHTVLAVGAHGAALHNHWFLPAGSGLIEITGEEGHQKGSSFFFEPAETMDLVYAPLYAKAVKNPRPGEGVVKDSFADFRNDDIQLDTTELKQAMHAVLDAVAKRRMPSNVVGNSLPAVA